MEYSNFVDSSSRVPHKHLYFNNNNNIVFPFIHIYQQLISIYICFICIKLLIQNYSIWCVRVVVMLGGMCDGRIPFVWTCLADLNSHSGNHKNRQKERYKAQIEMDIIHMY